MSVKALTVPSADEQQKLVYNRKVRASNTVELPLGKKLAVVVLQLSPAVTRDDYPAIGAALAGVAGIQDVNLVVDGETPVSIPEGTVLSLVAEVQLRIDDAPEE